VYAEEEPLEGPLEAIERLEVELALEEPGNPRQVVVEDEPAGRLEPLVPKRVAAKTGSASVAPTSKLYAAGRIRDDMSCST
jgi:hypothetical protein